MQLYEIQTMESGLEKQSEQLTGDGYQGDQDLPRL